MREADLADPNAVRPVVAVTSASFDPRFLARKYACGRFLRDTPFRIGGIDVAALGLFAYFAGPDKTIVERMLLDPLLTRLPPKHRGQYSHHTHPYFRPGHVWNDLPDGYVESLVSGENRIADPAIARLYDDLKLATEAPLLAPGRFAAIWRLNTGYDYGTDRPWRAVWDPAPQ
jgi:arabinofuranosyltransferase